jgi:hypothetical protein
MAPTLTPVDYDPFETDKTKLTPVDYDPFTGEKQRPPSALGNLAHNLGTGFMEGASSFGKGLADIADVLGKATGTKPGGVFRVGSQEFAKKAERMRQSGAPDSFAGTVERGIGSAPAGIADFMAGTPFAAIKGGSEAYVEGKNPLVGAAKAGVERYVLGKIFGGIQKLNIGRVSKAGLQAGTFGATTAVEGGSPRDIAASTAVGAALGLPGMLPGSRRRPSKDTGIDHGRDVEPGITEALNPHLRSGIDDFEGYGPPVERGLAPPMAPRQASDVNDLGSYFPLPSYASDTVSTGFLDPYMARAVEQRTGRPMGGGAYFAPDEGGIVPVGSPYDKVEGVPVPEERPQQGLLPYYPPVIDAEWRQRGKKPPPPPPEGAAPTTPTEPPTPPKGISPKGGRTDEKDLSSRRVAGLRKDRADSRRAAPEADAEKGRETPLTEEVKAKGEKKLSPSRIPLGKPKPPPVIAGKEVEKNDMVQTPHGVARVAEVDPSYIAFKVEGGDTFRRGVNEDFSDIKPVAKGVTAKEKKPAPEPTPPPAAAAPAKPVPPPAKESFIIRKKAEVKVKEKTPEPESTKPVNLRPAIKRTTDQKVFIGEESQTHDNVIEDNKLGMKNKNLLRMFADPNDNLLTRDKGKEYVRDNQKEAYARLPEGELHSGPYWEAVAGEEPTLGTKDRKTRIAIAAERAQRAKEGHPDSAPVVIKPAEGLAVKPLGKRFVVQGKGDKNIAVYDTQEEADRHVVEAAIAAKADAGLKKRIASAPKKADRSALKDVEEKVAAGKPVFAMADDLKALVPAWQDKTGKMVAGNLTDFHYKMDKEQLDTSRLMGFKTPATKRKPEGEFKSREEAYYWLQREDPETYKAVMEMRRAELRQAVKDGLKGDELPNIHRGLESYEYQVAKGIRKPVYATDRVPNALGGETTVKINPTKEELLGLMKKARRDIPEGEGAVRILIDTKGNLYAWNAYEMDHPPVRNMYGLHDYMTVQGYADPAHPDLVDRYMEWSKKIKTEAGEKEPYAMGKKGTGEVPTLNIEDFKKEWKEAKSIVKTDDGGLELTMDKGQKVLISPTGEIEFGLREQAAAREEYQREMMPDEYPVAKTQQVGKLLVQDFTKEGISRIANEHLKALWEGGFFRDREKRVMLKEAGNLGDLGTGYQKYVNDYKPDTTPRTALEAIFHRVMKFFENLRQYFAPTMKGTFEKIRTGEIGKRRGELQGRGIGTPVFAIKDALEDIKKATVDLKEAKPVKDFGKIIDSIFYPEHGLSQESRIEAYKMKGQVDKLISTLEIRLKDVGKRIRKDTTVDDFVDYIDKTRTGREGELKGDWKELFGYSDPLAQKMWDGVVELNPDMAQYRKQAHAFLTLSWLKAGEDATIGEMFDPKNLLGTKNFLKKRGKLTAAELIEAGYKLKETDPIKVVFHTAYNQARYVYGAKMIQEAKASGRWAYVPTRGTAPKGYGTRLADSAAKVYKRILFPEQVGMEEYVDTKVYQGLTDVAKALGIDVKRVVNAGRGRLGYASRAGETVVQRSTELGVMAHEVGHQIDNKFHLWDQLIKGAEGIGKRGNVTKTASTKERGERMEELRAIADLTGRRLSHHKPEQIAQMIEGYIHAPEVMKEVAPKIYEAFDAFARQTPELKAMVKLSQGFRQTQLEYGVKVPKPVFAKAFNVIDAEGNILAQFPSRKEAEVSMDRLGGVRIGLQIGIPKSVEAGEWRPPEAEARVLNNYVSKDKIRTNSIGKLAMGMKNMTTQVELLSGFHYATIAQEGVTSRLGLAIQQVFRGDKAGLKRTLTKGWHIGKEIKAYLKDPEAWVAANPGRTYEWFGVGSPSMKELVNAYTNHGGMIGHQDRSLRWGTDKWPEGIEKWLNKATDNKGQVAIGGLMMPLKKARYIVKDLLFEEIIPNAKFSNFAMQYAHNLKMYAPQLRRGEITKDELAFRAVRLVENKFGEMNWDNFWLDKNMKTALQLMFRSFTWQYGTWRGFGTMAKRWPEQIRFAKDAIRRGEKIPIDPDIAWVASLLMTHVAEAALIGYGAALVTGNEDLKPQTWFDYIYPKIGLMTRVAVPGYVKEPISLYRSIKYSDFGIPTDMVRSKMSGVIGRISDIAHNKDFYGTKVYDDQAPLPMRYAQAAKHMVIAPFSYTSYQKEREQGGGLGMALLSAMGIQAAPHWVQSSEAESMTERYVGGQMPVEGSKKEQFEDRRIKRQMLAHLRKGGTWEDLDQGIKDRLEKMPDARVERLIKEAEQTKLQVGFARLNDPDKYLAVWKVMTPKEKADTADLMESHIERAIKNLDNDPEGLERLMKKVQPVLDELGTTGVAPEPEKEETPSYENADAEQRRLLRDMAKIEDEGEEEE